MSELDKTTIQRFKTLAGLKQISKTTNLLKEHNPFEITEPPPAPVDVDPPEPAEPTEPMTPIEAPPPMEAPEAPEAPEVTMEEADPLAVMAENREEIVDKIADAMIKYLSDK